MLFVYILYTTLFEISAPLSQLLLKHTQKPFKSDKKKTINASQKYQLMSLPRTALHFFQCSWAWQLHSILTLPKTNREVIETFFRPVCELKFTQANMIFNSDRSNPNGIADRHNRHSDRHTHMQSISYVKRCMRIQKTEGQTRRQRRQPG